MQPVLACSHSLEPCSLLTSLPPPHDLVFKCLRNVKWGKGFLEECVAFLPLEFQGVWRGEGGREGEFGGRHRPGQGRSSKLGFLRPKQFGSRNSGRVSV